MNNSNWSLDDFFKKSNYDFGSMYPTPQQTRTPVEKPVTELKPKFNYILTTPKKSGSYFGMVSSESDPDFMILTVATENAYILEDALNANEGVERTTFVEDESTRIGTNKISRYIIIINPMYDPKDVYSNLKYNFDLLSKSFAVLKDADSIVANFIPPKGK